MSRFYGGWAPYVPVAERRRQAERTMAKLRKTGHPVARVTIAGRLIATTFWGRAWCDNMESYRDYESRLPRGRTYVRNGSVVDLQIGQGRITALVSGSELYNVAITIKETAKAQWRAICADCTGGIDSIVELLQGRFSRGVMERLCRQEGGLFPRPSDIRFSCSCPDHALMCKHVAAVLYGVGARLDHKPELLFRLRAVDETDLVAGIDTALPLSTTGPVAGKVLQADDVSALFGLDLAAPEVPAAGKPSDKPSAVRARRTPPVPEGVASAANAVVPRTAASKRAPAGVVPARPALTKRAAAANDGPIKPVAPKQGPAAAEATPIKPPAPKTAKASSRQVVPEKALAIIEVEGKHQNSVRTRKWADAYRRVTAASVATPAVLEVPAQGRGRRPASKDRTATARKPQQKPVKWW
jgi:uncharacterized Zn finger protein